MRSLQRLAIGLLLLAALITAARADDFLVADDSSSGTYHKMLQEMTQVCDDSVLNIKSAAGVSGGAPGNLDALFNNRVSAAFLHSDVFFANAQADPAYNKLGTLVALYPEPIHVLALRASKSSKKGLTNFGNQEFMSLGDAKGFKVGAAGGGIFTARILSGQGEGGFSVVQLATGADVLSALNGGSIDLAIFVGAAPLPNLEKLPRAQYKLIPIGEAIASHVSGVYRPTSITYPQLTSGPLKTLAPLATLLTRHYSTPAKIDAQRRFRECFYKHLDDIKDNGSPNWQAVEAGDKGVLPWMELPATVAPVSETPVASKKPRK